ncbi:hypothetical protein ABBQ32_002090 [Trebouxia sp. C0010 RCD-2024]
MEVIATIDQGTQSTRVYLYDSDANPVASHHVEFTQHRERAGWIEHDPAEIWQGVQECTEQAVKTAEKEHGKLNIKAVGITNQRETTVVWDKASGKPLHNAIVWMDNRTEQICADMEQRFGSKDHFRPVTGLPISTYFTSYKLKWLMDNVPKVSKAISSNQAYLGTMDTWLIYRLTGGADGGAYVTDISNAARTNLMEIRSRKWHPETCRTFGLQADMLAEIKSNAEIFGHVKEGPLKGVPIAGCLGDQHAALLGQRCKPQQAKNTYGTGCFLLLNTGEEPQESKHGLLTTIGYQLGPKEAPQYALEGSIAIGGAGVSWLRDQMGLINSAEESEAVASSVRDTAGVYFVPAFGGLLAPHWQGDARGVIVGLTSYTNKAHVVRALLQAICWQAREVMDAMQKDADFSQVQLLKVDGGASNNNLLMQMQADALQIPVHRPSHLETTSLGAAFAAGIGVGFWTKDWVLNADPERSNSQKQTDPSKSRVWRPQVDKDTTSRQYSKWQKAVKLSFGLADLAESDQPSES